MKRMKEIQDGIATALLRAFPLARMREACANPRGESSRIGQSIKRLQRKWCWFLRKLGKNIGRRNEFHAPIRKAFGITCRRASTRL